jgi:hypothetical protein
VYPYSSFDRLIVRSPIFFPFLEFRLFTRVGLIDTVLKIGFEYVREPCNR